MAAYSARLRHWFLALLLSSSAGNAIAQCQGNEAPADTLSQQFPGLQPQIWTCQQTRLQGYAQPHNAPRQRGELLLFADPLQSGPLSRQAQTLLTGLAAKGWRTTLLVPPPPPAGGGPGESGPAQAPPQPDPLQHYRSLLRELVAGVADSVQQPLVIVAEGSSAAWLANLQATSPLSQVNAMVLLDGYYPDAKANQRYLLDLSQLGIPILDVANYFDNHWGRAHIPARQGLMRHRKLRGYQFTELSLRPGPPLDARLPHLVAGWLTRQQGTFTP